VPVTTLVFTLSYTVFSTFRRLWT